MTERLLQFIWQFQYFSKSELATLEKDQLNIIYPGQPNTNQGPDFSNARIRIGATAWVGSVELHLKTSDWKKHHHHEDNHYSNVILHVVWENDVPQTDSMPLLELKDRVSKILLKKYHALMNVQGFIPCESTLSSVPPLIWHSWKETLLVGRLIRKAVVVETYLKQSHFHWEETFWWLLARNFGMKVNEDVFEEMARSIPLAVLARHKHQIHQLEAILMGQANLLGHEQEEDYPGMLKKEYEFYRKKYRFRSISCSPMFLRMRPVNFPTIRLAQLAMLVHESAHLFSKIKEAVSVGEVRKWFDVTANDYWHYHYRFNETSSFKKKRLGTPMIDSVIINTVAPVLFAYGNYSGEDSFKQKALEWLEATNAENNAVTRGFRQLNIENKNAFDSQSLVELKKEYCDKRRCLECAVGNAILKA